MKTALNPTSEVSNSGAGIEISETAKYIDIRLLPGASIGVFLSMIREKDISGKEIRINNFSQLYGLATPEESMQLIAAIVNTDAEVTFDSDFPFTKSSLEQSYKLSQLNNITSSLNNLESKPDEFSIPVKYQDRKFRAGRAAAKRRQKAEFDPVTKKMRNYVVLRKMLRIKEAIIVEDLKNLDEVNSNMNILPSTVNRLYKSFIELNESLISDDTGFPLYLDGASPNHVSEDNIDEPSEGKFNQQKLRRTSILNGQPIVKDNTLILDLAYTDLSFYLEFKDNNGQIVDILYITTCKISKERKVRIDILKQTVLHIGSYSVRIFLDFEFPDKSTIDYFRCIIGGSEVRIEGLKVSKGYDRNAEPIYLLDPDENLAKEMEKVSASGLIPVDYGEAAERSFR